MAKLEVKGTIISNNQKWIYDLFEMDSTSPKDILLPENNEPLEVVINSGGGDVYAGSEIYTALRDYRGDVTVKVVGIAASAASVIAMAGDTIEISPTAQIMIHNVSSGAYGDHRALAHEAEVLKNYNNSIANAYLDKTGIEKDELLELMNHETWLTAEQAVEKGFADKVMFANEEVPMLVASVSPVIPPDAISKLAEKLKPQFSLDDLAERVAEKLNPKKEESYESENAGLKRFFF